MRASSHPSRALRAVLLACVLLGASSAAFATPAGSPVEYRLKAAYLYNFTKFIEWPAEASKRSPFLVGVVDPEGSAARIIADALDGKLTADDRPIVVQRFTQLTADVARCHQLFLTRSAGLKPADACALIGSTSVLLVGETDDFAEQGGVIGLVISGDAVRCEVNLTGAQRAGVKLSGRLASVSRLVRETAQP